MSLTKADVIKLLIASMDELEDFNEQEGDPAISHGSNAGFGIVSTHLMNHYGLTFDDILSAREAKVNWFNTLNEALESEKLTTYWPFAKSLEYGENFRFHVEDGSKNGRQISIYRETDGRYERPIHYAC